MTNTATLPRIVQFIERTDSGEYGNDSCAHCGALGRYQFTFLGDDGKQHKAMAGCIKLYPVSPVARIHAELIKKTDDLRKRYGRDAHLNSWDTKKLAAIQDFYDGKITEDQAMNVIRSETAAAKIWRANKGPMRRGGTTTNE